MSGTSESNGKIITTLFWTNSSVDWTDVLVEVCSPSDLILSRVWWKVKDDSKMTSRKFGSF